MTFLWILACRPPLPEALELAYEDVPVAPVWGIGHLTTMLEAVPEGMIAIGGGGVGSLLIEDERGSFLPIFGAITRDAGDGLLKVQDVAGDFGYDYRARRFVPTPSIPAREAGAWIDGTTLTVRDGERRLPLDLPDKARAWVAEEGADGRVRVIVTPRRDRTLALSDAPGLLITVLLDPLAEESRFVIPEHGRATWGNFRPVRTVGGVTWAVVGGRLGMVRGTTFEPRPELGRIVTLGVDRGGRLWAGGDDIWRLTGVKWERMRAARADYDVGARVRAHSGPPLRHGSAVPAINAAMLVDGDVTCGDPSDPDRFLATWGGCERWLGLSAAGRVWAGNADGRVELVPPVGAVSAVSARDGWLFVAGTEGVAWGKWTVQAGTLMPDTRWTTVASSGAAFVDGWVSWRGVDVWFATSDSVCHTRRGAPVCAAREHVFGLAAGPYGAWVADNGRLYSLPPGGEPVDRGAEVAPENKWFTGVTYDAESDRVWTWSGYALHVFSPATREHRSYEAPFMLHSAAAVGDMLVLGADPGRVAHLR